MNYKNIKSVFSKEIVGAIRDKRTLITMIIVPLVFYPLLFIGMGYFNQMGNKKSEEAVSVVAIKGEEFALQLSEYLENQEKIETTTKEDNELSKLKNREIQAIIEIPPKFDIKVKQGEPSRLVLKYDTTEAKSRVAQKRINQAIDEYSKEIVSQRLNDLNLNEKIIHPFALEIENVASSEKVTGTFLGFLLPYLVIMLIFAGAMHTAIDITAGEKERGTIATLLVSQISRLEIVLGKFLSIMMISFSSMVIGLFGISISLLSGNAVAGRGGIEGIKLGMTFNTFLLLFLTLLPLVGLISAILVIVGIFARNVKEASSYITPIYMLTIFLGIISISQGIELSGNMFFVPVLNSSFVFKEILIGKIYWSHIITAFTANLMFAGIALFGATRLFNKEEVLFRS